VAVNAAPIETDLDRFIEQARAWLDQNAAPRHSPQDEQPRAWGEGEFSVAVFHNLSFEEEKQVLDDLVAWNTRKRQLGYHAVGWPVEFGGLGLTKAHAVAFGRLERDYETPTSHELFAVTKQLIAPTIAYHGTAEQKARFIEPLLATEILCCQLFSEPGAGSDLAGLSCRAVRDGGEWVVNGQKVWSSGAQFADWGLLITRSDPDVVKHNGMTVFMLPLDHPGVEVRPIRQMSGGSSFNEVFISHARIPDDLRIGPEGGGWKITYDQLTHGRGKIAAYQLGIAQRSIDIAVEGARERSTWGKKIASRQAVQWMIADSLVELEAARMLTYRAAVAHDDGEPNQTHAFMAKLYATEMAQRVTDRCLQILGGLGYSKELPVQSFYRQVRVWRIGHGTSEIHRWMIARDALGSAAKD